MPRTTFPMRTPPAPRRGFSIWVIVMLASSVACSGDRSRGAGGGSVDSSVPLVPADADSATGEVPSGEDTSSSEESGDPTLGVPGALALLESYFRDINAHRFHEAYHHWSDNGAASGLTLEEFARGYDRTRSTVYRVGTPGRIEGAAGSRYIAIPLTIEAVTTDGKHQRFRGGIVLRRVVVTGADPEERRWHIYSASIHEVH